MKKRIKIIALLLTIVIIFSMISACGNKQEEPVTSNDTPPSASTPKLTGGKDIYNDPIKIAFISMSTAGSANRLYQFALTEQASRYPNVSLNFMDGEFDPNRQITLMEEVVTQGYDAVILEAMDAYALNHVVDAAEESGVVVISLGNPSPTTTHTLHMAGADYTIGRESAAYLAEMTGGEGTAIILDCPAGFKTMALMGTGFEDYIVENTNIEILEIIGIDNWSGDNAQIAMRDVLTKYGPGEITMVYCASDDIANGAMNAITTANREGDGILLWGFMGYPAAFESIKEGKMTGTMFYDLYVIIASMFHSALYFIAIGANSRDIGYEETPYIETQLLATTIENVDYIMGASRWYRP